MTEQINPQIGQIESLFKEAVWDAAVESALASLFVAAPWMNTWPLRGIVRGLTLMLTNRIFSLLRLVIDLQVIQLLNSEHKQAFAREAVKLRIIAIDKGLNSPEYKRAKEDAKASLSRFIQFAH